METNFFRNWSSGNTLELPSLPNPFATESDQNPSVINDNVAPPKVFFPPKISLTKELGYKKKRPILEHISTSTNSPHRLPLKPTTSHPLNHQITTSPITPRFFEKFHNNNDDEIVEQNHHSSIIDKQNSRKNKEKIKLALRKGRSMPDINANTINLKNDLLKEVEKKVVIVHEVKPSDTIAGVALLYGIEISILKKANKLWTNDSIHLRKFLYIPIDQCSIIDDEAKVVVQEDHISIKTNTSSPSDNITRPSFSPTSTKLSNPFTIYERELLFCTLPEHANYINNVHGDRDHDHDHDHDHSHHSSSSSTSSTSSLWSSSSSSGSISSTASNTNHFTNNFTRAEIQQLPADKLTFFPSKRLTLKPSNPPSTTKTSLSPPTLTSPLPVSHLNRHQQDRSISYPLPTMTKDSTINLDNVGEKYRKKSFGPVKDERSRSILIGTESLNKVCNKKDSHLISPTVPPQYNEVGVWNEVSVWADQTLVIK